MTQAESLLPLTEDSIKETYAVMLGEGVPGAIIVLKQITDQYPEWPTLFGALLWHQCTGRELWCAFKDRHGSSVEALVETIRKDVKP